MDLDYNNNQNEDYIDPEQLWQENKNKWKSSNVAFDQNFGKNGWKINERGEFYDNSYRRNTSYQGEDDDDDVEINDKQNYENGPNLNYLSNHNKRQSPQKKNKNNNFSFDFDEDDKNYPDEDDNNNDNTSFIGEIVDQESDFDNNNQNNNNNNQNDLNSNNNKKINEKVKKIKNIKELNDKNKNKYNDTIYQIFEKGAHCTNTNIQTKIENQTNHHHYHPAPYINPRDFAMLTPESQRIFASIYKPDPPQPRH